MSSSHIATVAISTLLATLLPAAASAETLQLQGVLTSAGGGTAADGSYDMTFALYVAAKDPVAAWTEGPVKVVVQSGRFDYALGTTKKVPDAVVAQVKTGWLGVQVGAEPEFPRSQLHMVLSARRATIAEQLACSGCVANAQIANGTIAAEKLAFTWAGSKTKGGPASAALDLQCTGCVSLAELKIDGDLDLGGNGLKAKAVAATTVTAGKFVGDGSALTGIKIPTGECKTKGHVVKGIDADGSLQCVLAMDPAALPADGLDEISGDLLANQFVDDIVSKTTPKGIPDNNPVGIDDTLDFPDIGIAQKLNVHVHIKNSDMAAVTVSVFDPNNAKYVLYDKGGPGKELKASWPTPDKVVSGDPGTWVGKNPKGKWRLVVTDTKFLNNADDGEIVSWGVSIQTLSTKKVQVKGNLILATQTAPCDGFSKGAIRYNDAIAGIQVCDGKAWWPRLAGQSKDEPGTTCKTIKDDAPRAQSGVYWIDPDGAGKGAPFEVYCDQQTGGGGWTLVVKVKGNDATMNRKNTAQWRNKQLIGSCANTSAENALCTGYDKVPFSDVMIRSLAKPLRNLAWGHRDAYASMWDVVNKGTRVYTRNRLFGAVHNLDYNGDPVYHRDCGPMSFGFLTADWSQNNNGGIAGHNIPHGHAGGVVGASLNDWANWKSGSSYPHTALSTQYCMTDFALGGGYGGLAGNDSYAINSHWWGNGNEYSWNWNAHGVFLR